MTHERERELHAEAGRLLERLEKIEAYRKAGLYGPGPHTVGDLITAEEARIYRRMQYISLVLQGVRNEN